MRRVRTDSEGRAAIEDLDRGSHVTQPRQILGSSVPVADAPAVLADHSTALNVCPNSLREGAATGIGASRPASTSAQGPVLTRLAVTVAGLGLVAGLGVVAAPPVMADPPAQPLGEAPYHVLSSQDLCNLIWPTSQALPDPAEPVGTICVRRGGLLTRLSRAFPAFVSDTYKLAPGSANELPVGSVRIRPDDPLSDWLIPDCHIPNRIDCSQSTS